MKWASLTLNQELCSEKQKELYFEGLFGLDLFNLI
jgi:hypothetical protein